MVKHIFPRLSFPSLLVLLFAAMLGLSAGCSSEVGDECESTQDCPLEQGAICDTTVPGGYCLIQGCEVGSCPANSDCVVFDRNTRFCMALCNSNDDCRSGLVCRRDYNFANTSVGYCYAPAGAPPRDYPQPPADHRDATGDLDAADAAPDAAGKDATDSDTINLDTTGGDASSDTAGDDVSVDASDATPSDAPTPDADASDDASPDDASPDDASPDDASPDDASPDDASSDDASPDADSSDP